MHALGVVIKWIFLLLGVLFFLILSALAFGWYSNNLGAILAVPSTMFSTSAPVSPSAQNAPQDANPILNATQEAALRAVGVDPATIPTPSTITDEQKACLLNAVGEARAREIIAGAAPTFAELLSAKDCL